ncbi:MAG: AtpZ/AtpI family protein [Acidimicrobiales bacterium]
MPSDPPRNLFLQEEDGWSRAIELALTPVVAAGLGWLVDRVTGLFPAFTIVFFLFAVVATFVKMYMAYDKKMKEHDAEAPWGRAKARAAAHVTAGADEPGVG